MIHVIFEFLRTPEIMQILNKRIYQIMELTGGVTERRKFQIRHVGLPLTQSPYTHEVDFPTDYKYVGDDKKQELRLASIFTF